MVLRFVFRFLSNFANNEQFVSRLAESYPIRRSAQLMAYVYHRSNSYLKSGAIQDNVNPIRSRMLTFRSRFLDEFRKELAKQKSHLKK